MSRDKYSATWVSHSSISDFSACPRAYYLKNVYKDPKTGNKIQLISPPLALGQAVHEVIESLSHLPVDRRFETPIQDKLDAAWQHVEGKRGGFSDPDTEQQYKRRAEEMLRRVYRNPGPLLSLAVKINQKLPYFWLSDVDNIILCGKIDWLEYDKEKDTVHIIDFKTGRSDQGKDSLQLPIYYLLAHECQSHPVEKLSYWYIEREDEPTPQRLPDFEKSKSDILKIAKKIKLARQLGSFNCPQENGCSACRPFEAVLKKEAELVGKSDMGHDLYILPQQQTDEEESIIL